MNAQRVRRMPPCVASTAPTLLPAAAQCLDPFYALLAKSLDTDAEALRLLATHLHRIALAVFLE